LIKRRILIVKAFQTSALIAIKAVASYYTQRFET
jgi:hypothetical protein